MKQYLNALQEVLDNGTHHENRTGIDTISTFGMMMKFDLSEGFPAVTTKRLAWKAVVGELLWFLEGSTDERRLAEITFSDIRENLTDKSTIWTANADTQGVALGYPNTNRYKELGPVYGRQWRDFHGVDQIRTIVDRIESNPECRRIIMSAWNPKELPLMALPPCHVMSHFRVDDGKLHCLMYQRSADMFLGVPFNIASYALLTHMIASRTGLEVGEFTHMIGDAHIYVNHLDQVKEQLNRSPAEKPKLVMPKIHTLNANRMCEYSVNDFVLENYNPQATIKADMAV